LEYDIRPSLFTDPEFPHTKEIELKILIKQSNSCLDEKLRRDLYNLIETSLPSELIDKIIVDFETY
jgi:hypothetical protein